MELFAREHPSVLLVCVLEPSRENLLDLVLRDLHIRWSHTRTASVIVRRLGANANPIAFRDEVFEKLRPKLVHRFFRLHLPLLPQHFARERAQQIRELGRHLQGFRILGCHSILSKARLVACTPSVRHNATHLTESFSGCGWRNAQMVDGCF